jgi:hypothetical protein
MIMQKLKMQSQAANSGRNRVMEAETISKNGASLKSHTSRVEYLNVIL